MRDAKIYQIYEGTAQIQRIIIAREWMGLAKQRGLLGCQDLSDLRGHGSDPENHHCQGMDGSRQAEGIVGMPRSIRSTRARLRSRESSLPGNGWVSPSRGDCWDAKIYQIYEGTAQIQRIIIAREWMGLAKQRGLLGCQDIPDLRGHGSDPEDH